MEPLLWERFFERRPPDGIWLQRIAETIAILGYKIESFIAAYAGSKEHPDPNDWLWWQREAADTAGAPPAGPGIATEEEIQAAWGGAYETMRAENAGE